MKSHGQSEWRTHLFRLPTLLVWTMFFSLVFGLQPARAADSFKVGIVDSQAVLEKSKAGKRSIETLKEHFQIRQKLLGNDEEELKRLQEELQGSAGLSDAEKKTKQALLQRKFQEFQKRRQEFQQELNQKQNEVFDDQFKKMKPVIRAIAERKGFSLVIDKADNPMVKIVLYSRKGLDITNDVIKEFDRRFK